MGNDKKIKVLLICRIVFWIIALLATVYWIYQSFYLYTVGYTDEYVYASALRPILTRGLLISGLAIGISCYLRKISDSIKAKEKHSF